MPPLIHCHILSSSYLGQVSEVIKGVSEGSECLTSGQIEVFILVLNSTAFMIWYRQDLLNRRDFSKLLFALFVEAEGLQLKQEEFFSKMKAWTGVRILVLLPSPPILCLR